MCGKRNFLIGMGLGMLAGGAAGIAMMPKKRRKNELGKALSSIGDVIESVTDAIR